MSNTKHTPGPWIAVHNGSYWDVRTKDDQRVGDACASETFYEGTFADGPADKYAEANARLMAAAPDLLHRLSDLVEGLEGMDLPGALPARLKKARAAIVKATE